MDDTYITKMCQYDREYFILLTIIDRCHNLKYTMIPRTLHIILLHRKEHSFNIIISEIPSNVTFLGAETDFG